MFVKEKVVNKLRKIKLKNDIIKRTKYMLDDIKKVVENKKVIIVCSDTFLKEIMIDICHKYNIKLGNEKTKDCQKTYAYFYLDKDIKQFCENLSEQDDIYMGIYNVLEIVNACIIDNGLIERFFPIWHDNNEIIINYKNFMHSEQLNILQMDFMVTERCSLKCSECLNLMQYYTSPQDESLETIKKTLTTIDANVDELMELRLLGGEPFMNKELYEIIDFASKLKNIKSVVIFSNGTIVPDEHKLELLTEKKRIIFFLSNYGVERQKIEQVKNTLCSVNFACYVADYTKGNWIKHSAFKANQLNKEETDKLFIQCTGKTCPTVLGGKLYVCEYAANAIRLEAVPHNESDWVRLEESGNIKSKMKQYLDRREAVCPCYYCDRLLNNKNNLEYVEPGRQLQTALKYERVQL